MGQVCHTYDIVQLTVVSLESSVLSDQRNIIRLNWANRLPHKLMHSGFESLETQFRMNILYLVKVSPDYRETEVYK